MAVAAQAPDSTEELDPRRWRMLVFVALAQFMVLLDTTVVHLALPTVQREFAASTAQLQWAVNAYVLCFGGLMLLGGRAADRWGRRATFLTGAALFIGASLVCGAAPGIGALTAARAVQGCGAALLSPAAMSMVTTGFPAGRERTTALGVWAALAGLGGTAGVILGGLVTDTLSWRWIFYLNVPIGVAAIAGTLLVTRGRKETRQRGGRPDVLGSVLGTAALAALVHAVASIESHGLTSARCLLSAGAALLLALGFLRTERLVKDPLVPLGLFAVRTLNAALTGRLLSSAVQAGVSFLVSFHLQRVLGFSPLQAGVAFLPLGLAAIAVTAPATRVIHRKGTRTVYLAGGVLSLAGLGWLCLAPDLGSAPYAAVLLPALILLGGAIQACTIPVNVHGVTDIPERQQGLASGLLTSGFQIGSSLGLAVAAVALGAHTAGGPADWAEGIRTGYLLITVAAALNLLNALFGFRRPHHGTTR